MFKLFWAHIHKKYGHICQPIYVPIKILATTNDYGKWLYHYVIHDNKGKCICGQTSLRQAIKYVKEHPNTYLCKMWN